MDFVPFIKKQTRILVIILISFENKFLMTRPSKTGNGDENPLVQDFDMNNSLMLQQQHINDCVCAIHDWRPASDNAGVEEDKLQPFRELTDWILSSNKEMCNTVETFFNTAFVAVNMEKINAYVGE